MSEVDYGALANRLADPETAAPEAVAPPLSGKEATDYGRAFLLREFSTVEALNVAMRPGRPSLPAKISHAPRRKGESPTVRGRVPNDYLEAIKRLEVELGKSQSELVREGIHLLLQKHNLIDS